jgi:hypothetical protein
MRRTTGAVGRPPAPAIPERSARRPVAGERVEIALDDHGGWFFGHHISQMATGAISNDFIPQTVPPPRLGLWRGKESLESEITQHKGSPVGGHCNGSEQSHVPLLARLFQSQAGPGFAGFRTTEPVTYQRLHIPEETGIHALLYERLMHLQRTRLSLWSKICRFVWAVTMWLDGTKRVQAGR